MAPVANTSVVACPACGRKNRVPAAAPGMPRCAHCSGWLPWITEATDLTFGEVAERAKPFVIVDLWATWCGPCRMVSPELEKVAAEMAGRVKLVKVDVDRSPQLAQRFEVQAVPTLMVMKGGQVAARKSGAAPAPALREWVERAIDEVEKRGRSAQSPGR